MVIWLSVMGAVVVMTIFLTAAWRLRWFRLEMKLPFVYFNLEGRR